VASLAAAAKSSAEAAEAKEAAAASANQAAADATKTACDRAITEKIQRDLKAITAGTKSSSLAEKPQQ